MNRKQSAVLALGVIGIILIVIFTPRYKITWLDSNNFVKTEQTSSLYKRSAGTVKFHWEKILVYSSITVVACGILLFVFKEKRG